MVYALTATDPNPGVAPYLTVDEYLQALTGLDVYGLVPGDREASIAELAQRIARASSWADNLSNQTLAACPDTESARLYVNREGKVLIHPRQTPVVEVTGISWGLSKSSMAPMADLTGVYVEPDYVEFAPGGGVAGSWAGGLSLAAYRPFTRLYVAWSYVAGWPNTTLAAAAGSGDTSIEVTNTWGIVPGQTGFTIYDGPTTETVQVADTYVPGSTTVPLQSGLAFQHSTTGVGVSALPPVVKQAVILLTSALIKTRGSEALIMQSVGTAPTTKSRGEPDGFAEARAALDILQFRSFGRVR